jgi:hypothetical protein
VTDVDGNTEERKGTTSVFNGPPPVIGVFETPEEEATSVAQWLKERIEKDGVQPEQIGIFLRDLDKIQRAECALKEARLSWQILDQAPAIRRGCASVGSMHLAKASEFRAVAVMACDDEVIHRKNG